MLRVLELYSGIGGLHYAFEESGIPHEVVAAADINTVANEIYKHNFPNTKILQRCIESLTVKELDVLAPDLIHMSPPCQPFTRVGKQQDASDQRSKSFLHLIETIPRLKKQPAYIFLENVKGFDTSESRRVLLEMLDTSGYKCQEFLVSPLQFGIPNSRLRYYLLAKLQPRTFGFDTKSEIWENIPPCARPFLSHVTANDGQFNPISSTDDQTQGNSIELNKDSCKRAKLTSDTTETIVAGITAEEIATSDKPEPKASVLSNSPNSPVAPLHLRCQSMCSTVSRYLETGPEDYLLSHTVPDKFLKRFYIMDIIRHDSKKSCCFTKRYGHHIEGAGSILQTADGEPLDLTQYMEDRIFTPEIEKAVRSMKLRFFTPREIANFMCFPKKFEFPASMTTIQLYRVLGNSLNVHVVSVLLRLLLLGDNFS